MADLLEFGTVQRAFIGVSIREIDNKLAEEKKLILMEGLMYRFHPQILELKKRIHSGKYGKILKIRASMSFDYGGIDAIKRRLESGGGALPRSAPVAPGRR